MYTVLCYFAHIDTVVVYKNRILFLYDSTSDNFVKSNWVKYYRNRGIKTKFLDYQTYENLTIFIDWLKNS